MTAARPGGHDGEEGDGASRISRDRMSPIEGPPRQRKISEDDPPSSEMGRTNAELEGEKTLQMELPERRTR